MLSFIGWFFVVIVAIFAIRNFFESPQAKVARLERKWMENPTDKNYKALQAAKIRAGM